VNTRKAWIVYTVLRLAFFAVPFAALMLIDWPWWLAAITAMLVGISLSVIFLSRPRETAATSVYDWRNRDRTVDDIAEDAALAEAEATAAPADSDEESDLPENR
jgi:hypothetical protein